MLLIQDNPTWSSYKCNQLAIQQVTITQPPFQYSTIRPQRVCCATRKQAYFKTEVNAELIIGRRDF